MFENPRRDRLTRNFAKNVQKILDLKSSSEQIFSRKLSLGAPVRYEVTQQYGFLQKKKLSTSVVKQLFRYKLNRKEKPLLFHTIL